MLAVLVAALVVAWVVALAVAFLVYHLLRQNGRVLLTQQQLAAAYSALAQREPAASPVDTAAGPTVPAGLAIGTPAPDFALPDLEGRERRLSELLGRPRLLVFFSTTCGYCVQMSPRLAELPPGAPEPILVSQGGAEEHRRMAEAHGWPFDEVLLTADWEIASRYETSGTPTGYLIGADGRIASELLVGADRLLDRAEAAASLSLGDELGDKQRAVVERAQAAGLRVRDVGSSRLKRDGLRSGTPAPDFSLPDLDDRTRSLSEYRGTRVLLVFSDTGCGPCQALGPELVRLQGALGGSAEVVMISRGGLEPNRAKADEFGYTFPVLLQKSWEVSRDYAMFATPIAYLIDEHGMIAGEVAVGNEAILQLAETARLQPVA